MAIRPRLIEFALSFLSLPIAAGPLMAWATAGQREGRGWYIYRTEEVTDSRELSQWDAASSCDIIHSVRLFVGGMSVLAGGVLRLVSRNFELERLF